MDDKISEYILWGIFFIIFVFINPGAIAFTLIPFEANSFAAESVNPSKPDLDDEYKTCPLFPDLPKIELIFMID